MADKWEYFSNTVAYVCNPGELIAARENGVPIFNNVRLNDYLTKFGQAGWELVAQSITATGEVLYTFGRRSS